VTAVWILPFYPSPLKDDGYDIADYYNVHPMYGTLADFKLFLREAHRRGLRVITELVLNHTSDQHPWFQRARRAKPGSRWRDFYVWSDTPEKYKDTRVIFKDIEVSNWTWDHLAGAYYWHRFFSHQPDLNYDNPEVHEEMTKVLDFWLDLGVDGVRLDAVPYLYEREGTSCENLPETHLVLQKLRAHVDAKYRDRMLLGEANQWPEDAVAYFGQGRGDECHMAFHFPLMPRLFMAVRMEDRMPIVDILEQTPPIPETSQWALFLRNHDELTLEMVTDEERDYMYRMYAHLHQARLNLGIRRRLAPLLGNDRKRIELMNALLFSLPGTPVLYYGDELGMGENIYLGDRNGVRTPMQWSSDKNAGFSRANPQRLYLPIILDPEYHYEANNVEAQIANPHSLLWWMRRLLALRKRWRALGEGKCEFLAPENRKILAYTLRHQQETLLVVANLSRFVQPVELDLSAFKQMVPIELFGRMEFPAISEQPYFLTLGPHSFYWFSLEAKFALAPVASADATSRWPSLQTSERWQAIFAEKEKFKLEAILPAYLKDQRWFAAKTKTIKLLTLLEAVPVPIGSDEALLTLLQVDYVQGDSDLYALAAAFATGKEAESLREQWPQLVFGELTIADQKQTGLLYDAVGNKAFCHALLDTVARRRRIKGTVGELEGSRTPALRRLLGIGSFPEPTLSRAEQSNSSILYGDKVILKLFRRLDEGINPDLELGRFLTERGFPNVPPLVGALEYAGPEDERLTVGTVHGVVASAKDAWQYTLDALGRYYDRALTSVTEDCLPPSTITEPVALIQETLPTTVADLIGTYLESARLLGVRTAELHRCLASEVEDKAFAPEPFTPHYVRGLFQSMRNLAVQNLRLLRRQLKNLPNDAVSMAQRVIDLEQEIVGRYRPLFERRLTAKRTRIHGDYHLGQALWTGKDFIIFDFEGEPAIALSERRLKHSPLRDVAGMARSFHYAAYAGLYQHVDRGSIPPEKLPRVEPWARFWNAWVSAVFLKAYFQSFGPSEVLPKNEEDVRVMLQAYLLNKAVYELGYELNNRPSWVKIPLQGILHLMAEMPMPNSNS
jgi:maltose alpha-D-glucosyltransferase/alpha-amylase